MKKIVVNREFETPSTVSEELELISTDDANLDKLLRLYREEFVLPALELAIRSCVSRILILREKGAKNLVEIREY